MSALTTVELFAGIGGFRIASDHLGLETLWANDNNPLAAQVYKEAFGDGEFLQAPVEAVLQEVPSHDILTGGFPCQPYSSAGKKLGLGDTRASTVQALLSIAATRRPAAIVLENVPNLLAVEGGNNLRYLVRRLLEMGYGVEWRVINAADVGLPQYRPRLLITALADRGIAPVMVFDPDEQPPMDVSQPFSASGGGLPAWGTVLGDTLRVLDDKPKRQHRDWSSLRVSDWLDAEVGAEYDFTEQTIARLPMSKPINRIIRGVEVLFNQAGGSRMGYTVYGTRGIAPALTATTSRHYERFRLNDRFRRLTPNEYARLQGFPDSHCDVAAHGKRYVLCGNAIPPQLAQFALERALGSLGLTTTAPESTAA